MARMADKKKILVVDDEPYIVELLKLRLESNGYEVLIADDGDTGLEKAETEKPDLILLDVMMPTINGVEVCRLLKENQFTKHIPVILLTVKNQQKDRVLGLSAGSDFYIAKPYDPRDLLDKVNQAIKSGGKTPV